MFAALYLHSGTETKLVVDTSRGERLHVNVSNLALYSFLIRSLIDSFAVEVGGRF